MFSTFITESMIIVYGVFHHWNPKVDQLQVTKKHYWFVINIHKHIRSIGKASTHVRWFFYLGHHSISPRGFWACLVARSNPRLHSIRYVYVGEKKKSYSSFLQHYSTMRTMVISLQSVNTDIITLIHSSTPIIMIFFMNGIAFH